MDTQMNGEQPESQHPLSRSVRGETLRRMLLYVGVITLLVMLFLLHFTHITHFLYGGLVKDPDRTPPTGNVIVSAADGVVLYVKRVTDGKVANITKRGAAIPISDIIKRDVDSPPFNGWRVGVYMSTHGVHVNRIPLSGMVKRITVHNGPHINETEMERHIILAQLVPGWVTLKKWWGMPPFNLEKDADYILKNARETVELVDQRGTSIYIVRVADPGNILTWVKEGQPVTTGEYLGMMVQGSPIDLLIEEAPGLSIEVEAGDHLFGGESVLARY